MVKCRKIEIAKEQKNTAYWIIDDDKHKDFTLYVEINYIDIYSAGYVYDITAYCPESNIKIQYKRVKSDNNLLKEESAVCDYFGNGDALCESMAELGFTRSEIKKKELSTVKNRFGLNQ